MSHSIKKYVHVSPGGMKCPCCFPGPGTRSRKLTFRSAKRKHRRDSVRYDRIADPGDDRDLLHVFQEYTDPDDYYDDEPMSHYMDEFDDPDDGADVYDWELDDEPFHDPFYHDDYSFA